ncbi:MAG TPA: hypothetical protein VFG83_01580 [Kofleriaceae bacterium]|nr:hypothetical protein [Kofleriaceae bacterium]
MHKTALTFAATLILVTVTMVGQARADQYRYIGVHPIPARGKGKVHLCHIRAPHVHAYAPVHADVLYRDYDGWAYFVGDPVAYGYDGDTHVYVGAHPIEVDADVVVDVDVPAKPFVVYCYLKGPHYHVFAPPDDAPFTVKADAYYYVGDYPDSFRHDMDHRVGINVIYEPIVYTRPVIEVEPPVGYHDVFVDVDVHAHPVVVHEPPARAHVGGGISVGIEIPVPTLEVNVGGGVVVHEHHHGRGHAYGHRKYKHKKHKHWH